MKDGYSKHSFKNINVSGSQIVFKTIFAGSSPALKYNWTVLRKYAGVAE